MTFGLTEVLKFMWSKLYQLQSHNQIMSNHECGWLCDTEEGMQGDGDGMWHACLNSGLGAPGFLLKGYRVLNISSLQGNSCRQEYSCGEDAEMAHCFWLAEGEWPSSHCRQTMPSMAETFWFHLEPNFGNFSYSRPVSTVIDDTFFPDRIQTHGFYYRCYSSAAMNKAHLGYSLIL